MNNTKVLYVDDEVINLQLMEINLKRNFQIFTADSAREGLKIIDANTDIKVVISDMKMPNINGIEFIKMAKEKHPEIRYYILTGYDINDEIEDALQKGLIIKYFRKPFNINEIEAAINETSMSK